MTTPSIDRQIEKSLQDKEVRYTAGRRTVVAALAAADGPRSAAELHRAIGDAVPLSSLYRTLTVLQEADVVVPHFGVQGLTRFELAEWLAGHHHHLICISCGAVDDIDLPPAYERRVQTLVDDISSMAAFTPAGHAVEIEGRCARCA
jgi:Fur family ferric uptake transcriptional regulator